MHRSQVKNEVSKGNLVAEFEAARAEALDQRRETAAQDVNAKVSPHPSTSAQSCWLTTPVELYCMPR